VGVAGKTVGFIGGGNMGEALIKGLAATGVVPPGGLWASDVRADHLRQLEKAYGLHTTTSNAELVGAADVVVLAVKPQTMSAVLREIAPAIGRRHLVVSVAAGVPSTAIRAALGEGTRLIRVMPNTPALVLEGATAIARAGGLEPGDLDVGVNMGLDRATAMTRATQTVRGAARLLRETGMHPGALKDMVSSPGGTTIAGIAALEAGGARTAFITAVERATMRSRELGRT
jgi:pyrroline-5-carboxylate reductase